MMIADIARHYNALAPQREHYLKKNAYYYSLLYKQYQYFIPPGKRILEVGCATGALLNALRPCWGVGCDVSDEMIKIARARYPQLQFFSGELKDLKIDQKFDYIVLSGVLGEAEDIQQLLRELKRLCTNDTRIIIEYYSYLWQYLLKVAEKFNAKMPQRLQNWLTHGDLFNFLTLEGYEPVKIERSIVFPKKIPGLSYFLNRYFAKLPVVNALTLNHFVIARPMVEPPVERSVTIVVPCRNEKGNIESVIRRTPKFGLSQEFIFVEGGSKDGTFEEISRVMGLYPEKSIKLLKQQGQGKGDAVRLGFSAAQNEVLMILDADLTVTPEDLPKFYQAIRDNRAEFINGCRLVYPMEKEAMRFLNLIANKCFGLFFSWLLGQRFKDTLCGTKVLLRKHYEQLVQNRSYFDNFDPFGDFDLIFGVTKLNLKIIELPIRYKERQYGETQIQRFRHGLLLARMCWFALRKIKWHD